MKILTVSDREEPLLTEKDAVGHFPGVDLILSCGDLPPEYLTRLVSAFNVPLYYVRGNHDIRYGDRPLYGCTDLHARVEKFKGLRFLGLEGSRWYNGGPQQYTDIQMRKMILSLWPRVWREGGVDIVIAHAPPRYIHDAEDPCHKGFKSFRTLINRYSPAYFFHGHIHAHFTDPSQRMTVVNGTHVINTYGHYLLDIKE